jgi:hypothetical protein
MVSRVARVMADRIRNELRARVADGVSVRMLLGTMVLVGVGMPVAMAAGPKAGEPRQEFVDVPSLSERRESQRPRPDVAVVAARMTAATQRRRERREFLATAGQRETRRASRQRFKSLGARNALKVAREEQSVVSGPVWRPVQLTSAPLVSPPGPIVVVACLLYVGSGLGSPTAARVRSAT